MVGNILEITIPRGRVVLRDRKLCSQRVEITATSRVPRFSKIAENSFFSASKIAKTVSVF